MDRGDVKDRGLVPSTVHLVVSNVCCHSLTRYLDLFNGGEAFNNLPDVGAYVHQMTVICITKYGCSQEHCFFTNICHRTVGYQNNISINPAIFHLSVNAYPVLALETSPTFWQASIPTPSRPTFDYLA